MCVLDACLSIFHFLEGQSSIKEAGIGRKPRTKTKRACDTFASKSTRELIVLCRVFCWPRAALLLNTFFVLNPELFCLVLMPFDNVLANLPIDLFSNLLIPLLLDSFELVTLLTLCGH